MTKLNIMPHIYEGKVCDMIEVDGKPIAVLLPGINPKDLNIAGEIQCDCDPGYDDDDLERAADRKRDDVLDFIRRELKGTEMALKTRRSIMSILEEAETC